MTLKFRPPTGPFFKEARRAGLRVWEAKSETHGYIMTCDGELWRVSRVPLGVRSVPEYIGPFDTRLQAETSANSWPATS